MDNFNRNLKDLLNVFTKRDNMQVEEYTNLHLTLKVLRPWFIKDLSAPKYKTHMENKACLKV